MNFKDLQLIKHQALIVLMTLNLTNPMECKVQERMIDLRDSIDEYLESTPPNLGIHVSEGIKPEIKQGR